MKKYLTLVLELLYMLVVAIPVCTITIVSVYSLFFLKDTFKKLAK